MLGDFLEISWNHTQEGLGKITLVKIETGSKIPALEGTIRTSLWEQISAADQEIFTKFGGYVDNKLPQGVEWSKHISFKNPIWQMATIHHTCNLSEFWERPGDGVGLF